MSRTYRNYRELSTAEVSEIAALYPTTPNREIIQRYGISLDGLIDHLARPYGWKKDLGKIRKGKRRKRILSDKDIQWLIAHFKHTLNADIMKRLDIGESQLHSLARQYGLRKSPQQMRKTQAVSVEVSRQVCRKHGIYEQMAERLRKQFAEIAARGERYPGAFKPGQSNKDRLSPERYRESLEKANRSFKETVRKERMRLHFGLPQKTNLKLTYNGYTKAHRQKSVHRYLFRKCGYIVEYGSDTVYYDEQTDRRPRMEANAPLYGLEIKEIND